MDQFDANEYFNKRLASGNPSKLADIQAARDAKIQAMGAAIERNKVELPRIKAIHEKTLNGLMGIDSDNALGVVVDVADAIYEGGKNTLRSIGAAGNTATGDLKAVDAYGAAQKAASEQGPLAKQTLMQDIDQRKKADADPGVISAVQNVAGAMIDNPRGAAQFVAEQAPNSAVSLGAGWAGMQGGAAAGSLAGPVGTVVGGGLGFLGGMFLGNALLETGGKAMEKANDGGFTEAKRAEALQEGAVKGAVITGVDALTLGVGGKLASTFNKAAIEAGARAEARVLSNAGVNISDAAAVEAALADPVLREASKVAGQAAANATSGVGTKAATAATGITMETGGEGVGEHLGELAATGKADVYDSVLEAAAGFTQSAPETAYNMRKASGNDLNVKGMAAADLSIADPVVQTKGPKNTAPIKSSVQTGDVDKYLDPKSMDYAPDEAVAALHGNSQLATATPEIKKTNFEKASKIVSDLESHREDLQMSLDGSSPESLKKVLATKEMQLNAASDPAERTKLEQVIGMVKDEIAALEKKPVDPKDVASLTKRLSRADEQIKRAHDVLATFHQESQPKDMDLVAEAAKIDGSDSAASKDAASNIINLSMAAPELLDTGLATSLAGNETKGLSTPQRAYLRAFTPARIAANALRGLSKVSEEILFGSDENVGIVQYRTRTMAALSAGNKKAADKQITALTSFSQDHEAKAQQTTAAYAAFKTDGNALLVRSDGNRGWYTEPVGNRTPEQVDKLRADEGAVLINEKSPKLVARTRKEADALNAAVVELNAAYDNQFTPSSEVTNVENVSKAPARSETATEGTETTAKTEASSAETGGTAGDAADPTVLRSEEPAVKASAEKAPASAVKTVESKQEKEQLQSTEGAKDTTDKVESGALNALKEKSPEGTAYTARNLLADFFSQSGKRPLTMVKNFISQLRAKNVKISDYLDVTGEELTDKQKDAVRMLVQKVQAWSPQIQKNLVKGYWNNTQKQAKDAPDFAYTDLMQFLIEGTNKSGLDLEENVKTAIVYAAIRAVSDSAENGDINSPEAINSMMGRSEEAPVSDTEQQILGEVGLRENTWRNSVGRAAVAALGFKLSADAPADLMARLESSFGAHVEKLLMDVGMLERTSLTATEMTELFPEEQAINGKQSAPWKFLRLARNAEGDLSTEATKLVEANKGTKNILDKLFSVPASVSFPSLEKIPMTQKTAAGVAQGIPSNIADAVEEKQSEAGFVRDDSWAIMEAMPREAYLEMTGYVDPDTNVIHAANMASTRAKNEGLAREYDRTKQFVTEMLLPVSGALSEVPFYLLQSVWKQQRVGIAVNGFNPQGSKQQRNMFYKSSWKHDIALDNQAQMDNFRLRVSEAMGAKTDSQTNETTLSQFEALFDPALNKGEKGIANATKRAAAIKVLQAIMYDAKALTNEEVRALVDGVAVGGEKTHSLAALQDMAHYMQAKEQKQATFTVHMQGEIDGKTNGIVLSQLLFGGAADLSDMRERMRRGGFFFNGDGVTQFNHWKAQAGNLDSYESLTKHIVDLARDMVPTNPAVFAAIEAFTKPLELEGKIVKAGRDLTKNPLTTMMFGASLFSATDKIADKVIGDLYKRIVEVATWESAETIQEVLTNLNTLILAGKGNPVNPQMTVNQALAMKLDKSQIKAIKKAFHATLGTAAKEAIGSDYADYLRSRDTVNRTANLIYDLSNAVISAMREEYIKGLVETDKNGAPLHALTRNQEKEFQKRVKKFLPLVHTVGSKRDGKITNGVSLAKTENVLSTNPVYQGKAYFGTAFPDTVGRTDRNGKSVEAFSATLNSNETVQGGPGVGTSSKQVHSLDSSTSHDAQRGREVSNNHDALNGGLAGFNEMGTALNESLWNNVSEYSPMGELLDSLTNMLKAISELSVDSEGQVLSEGVATKLAKPLNELASTYGLSAQDSLNMLIKEVADAAYQADKMKFDTLAQVVSVDQYTLEGGNFAPSDEDRQAMATKSADLSAEVALDVFEAVDSLTTQLGAKLTKPAAKEPKAKGSSAFGSVGPAKVVSDIDLVEVFNKRGQLNTKQVLHVLRKKFNQNTVNREILEKLAPLLSADLVVKYITPESTEADVLAMPTGPSRGWFVSKDGHEAIYVLSPAMMDSGLTPELLLHELLHAALAQVINNPSAEAKALVEELNQLRLEAKKVIDGDASLSEFNAAVDSVDELVSWGMTNQDFQVKVLGKVRMASKTQRTSLISGMKAFIESVTSLLFRRPTEKTMHGVSILVSNVSGLIAEAQSNKGTTDVNLSMAAKDPVGHVDSFKTLDIHQALNDGALDSEFQQHLANLLGGIVEKLHGPFGAFAAEMAKTAARTPLDVWAKAKETGKAPFASRVLANMAVSEQEAFAIEQVEATVRAALEGNEAPAKEAYRALYKLYTEMYNKFDKAGSDFFEGDWSKATSSEKAWAKSQFDFVFKLDKESGERSDYLARFAALGMAHQGFNRMLQTATAVKVDDKSETILQKLEGIWNKILTFFNEKVTHTFAGQQADQKLVALVDQLVDIEAKKRMVLKQQATEIDPLGTVEEGARQVMETVRSKAGQIADSEYLRSKKNGFIGLSRTVVSKIANHQVQEYLDTVQDFYEKKVQAQGSIFVSILRELNGHNKVLQMVARQTKKFEHDRKGVISSLAKQSKEVFLNKADKKTSAALTAVLLRTGMHNLMQHFSFAELENLVGNSAAVDTAIADFESKLGHMKAAYVAQVKGLAYYKATELTKVKVLMMNAHLIARMAGTKASGMITADQATKAEPTIKALIALYALKYTSDIDQQLVKEVFRTENGRTDGNGVEFVLALHEHLEKESLAREFRGNPALMVHGYTPEILNPHTEFQVVDEEEGKELMDLGYSQGDHVSTDPADPDRSPKRVYVLRGAGLSPRISGAILFESKKAKGTKVQSGYVNVNNVVGVANASVQAAFDMAKLHTADTLDPNWDPSTEATNYAAPVYNEHGHVVNWRYLMNKTTKDQLMQRNNAFDQVLGVHGGSTFSKENTLAQNRNVLEALREIYKDDFAINKDAYVWVGPDSSNAELREIWALLSPETKADVRKVWGIDGIAVKADALDLIFGYRQRSVSEIFDKQTRAAEDLETKGLVSDSNKLNMAQASVIWAAEYALAGYARIKLSMSKEEAARYAKRAAAYMVRGERAWQETVGEVKSIYVIKNIKTLAGNEKSNVTQLLASGVNPKDIINHRIVATKAAEAYQADSAQLKDLETRLAIGYTQGNQTDIEREIIRLRDAIDRNPVKELIDAGLMPSIVEDIAEEEDVFSYKTQLAERTEHLTNKLHPVVKDVAKQVWMASDTKLYQFLHHATQMSDFVARYTLYQHLISRKNNPLSKQDAIHEASEAFVNYDIPMHRDLQYTDAMGLTMFTKYFMRMQRVLLKMGRENPARALALAATDHYLNIGSNVLDSSFVNHIGNNPVNGGAFEIVNAIGELPAIRLLK